MGGCRTEAAGVNYLAHAFLSGDDEEVLTGNLIADFVKGPFEDKYSAGVCRGIVLHRKIDRFTDTHPLFLQSVDRVRGEFRHYGIVLIDIFYDHLLGRNFDRFSPKQTLDAFVGDVDACFQRVRKQSPGLFHPRWLDVNWLASYAEKAGLERSLKRVAKRARKKLDWRRAVELMEENYDAIEQDFLLFFPAVIEYVERQPEFSQ